MWKWKEKWEEESFSSNVFPWKGKNTTFGKENPIEYSYRALWHFERRAHTPPIRYDTDKQTTHNNSYRRSVALCSLTCTALVEWENEYECTALALALDAVRTKRNILMMFTSIREWRLRSARYEALRICCCTAFLSPRVCVLFHSVLKRTCVLTASAQPILHVSFAPKYIFYFFCLCLGCLNSAFSLAVYTTPQSLSRLQFRYCFIASEWKVLRLTSASSKFLISAWWKLLTCPALPLPHILTHNDFDQCFWIRKTEFGWGQLYKLNAFMWQTLFTTTKNPHRI